MQAGTPGSFRPRVSHVIAQIPKKGEVRNVLTQHEPCHVILASQAVVLPKLPCTGT